VYAEKTQPPEPDEDELKISFMNFKAGSIALFVPVDASRKVWMAFHSNKPNRFLAQVCAPPVSNFNLYCVSLSWVASAKKLRLLIVLTFSIVLCSNRWMCS